jgi:integral membrane sensor domain MASE1
MASLDKAVMNKQYQRVLVTTPHPLLRLVCLGLVTFIFTLFSLELTRFGTLLAPLWFPTAIMMVAFYRHAGKMWPGIALACSFGNILASWMLFSWGSISLTYPRSTSLKPLSARCSCANGSRGTTRCRI